MKISFKLLSVLLILAVIGFSSFQSFLPIEPAIQEGANPKTEKIRLQAGFKLEHLLSPSDMGIGSWVSTFSQALCCTLLLSLCSARTCNRILARILDCWGNLHLARHSAALFRQKIDGAHFSTPLRCSRESRTCPLLFWDGDRCLPFPYFLIISPESAESRSRKG